ncbi:hypothetical protein RND81_04G241000 [Saponaria officinalis]|uniref:Non-haem dioxygenase N-terminal domain-containing protein n=1 Tax=Saponaria officinalis TaxID=3572 RepID=A0AAW1LGM6_SAPOF
MLQPTEHRPNSIIKNAHVIDLGPLTSTDDIGDDLVSATREACAKWGFFQVTKHGVPLQCLHSLKLAAQRFFSSPDDYKAMFSRDASNPLGFYDSQHTKNVTDWKQVFDFTARDPTVIPVFSDDLVPKQLINRWPPELSYIISATLLIGFSRWEVAQTYAREVEKPAFKLMELIALSLQLEPTVSLSTSCSWSYPPQGCEWLN